ncbi:MAG: hypothetical protein ACFB21_06450 [Opitutales bacterium]
MEDGYLEVPDEAQIRHLGHDLRSHLTVIATGLEVLETLPIEDPTAREIIRQMRYDGVAPLKTAMNDFVTLARTAARQAHSA